MQQSVNFRIGGPITPIVKKLMIANAAVFIIQEFTSLFAPGLLESVFGLNHQGLIYEFKLWQVFTYMFLHGGWMHIIFNLLALWMFAGDLEELWGGKIFLRYYLFSGIGAGLFIAVMNAIAAAQYGVSAGPTTIGASGAIYGILLAYGLTWPNREVLIYFLFPVKMKYLLLVFGLIEFFGTLSGTAGAGGNISHIGHLGGLVSGFVFLMSARRKRPVRPGAPAAGRNPISGFFRKRRLKKKQKEIDERITAKKIIDVLLEKIAREGMNSLTREERVRLEWARRHYYPEDNETIH